MTDSTLETVLRRDRFIVAGALGIIIALAWGYVLWLANDMDMGGMDMTGFRMIPAGLGIMLPAAAPWKAIEFAEKSSQNNTISQVPAEWDPNLKTFTVFAWTSTSRKIMNPYDLVFSLRPANDQISHKDAKAVWNNIAESTLKGDDLAKFLKHLDDDD